MSADTTKDQLLNSVIDQLCSLEGVTCEAEGGGRTRLTIAYNGMNREVSLSVSDDDYRVQKIQFNQICQTLTDLGIEEGQTYVAPPLPRRPMTPPMRAAREQQKSAFDAWQQIWRTLRKAEKALDVDYEFKQMRDYY